MRAEDRSVIAIVGEACQVSAEAARGLSSCDVAVVDVAGGGAATCDILVVGLGGGSLTALEWSLARWSALGRPELVFVSADVASDPLARGLGAAGVRYVLPAPGAVRWLRD